MTVSSPRDLAWCRAAFRDLDAPLPGQPADHADQHATRRAWGTGPVEPGPAAARLAPRPSTAALIDAAVAASGFAPRRVDTVGAMLLVWDEITRVGTAHLEGDPAAARALRTVRARWDVEESMIWNVFGHHGELGVRAHRAVVHELYTLGSLHDTLVAAISAGTLLRF